MIKANRSVLVCLLMTILLIVAFLPEVAANPLNSIVEWLREFWSNRPTIERVILGFITFFLFAGLTGLDGGRARKVNRIPLEDATSKENPRVFFDVTIDGKKAGKITMELFANVVPKTAENFRCLCTGEKGIGKSGKPLHYKGCAFHRVIPGFMCQSGDFTRGDGTGGESIYGTRFDDEWDNGFVAHTVPGLLSSANAGRNTNGSQLFLTTAKTLWLDVKHVVFGRVESGMDVVKAVEAVGSANGTPSARVIIADCGQVKTKKA